MISQIEVMLANSQLQEKLGVDLNEFKPHGSHPYLAFDKKSIESEISFTSEVDMLSYIESCVEKAGNILGYYYVFYHELSPQDIASAIKTRSKISNAFRLLVGYSLPPGVKQFEHTGFDNDVPMGIDLPRFTQNQLLAYTDHLPLFQNLKELYLDKALSASSLKKYQKRKSTAYLWDGLAKAASQLVHLEVISLRENDISKYNKEDFAGLLKLLSQAKSVKYVDLSRNKLSSLKPDRVEQLMTTLRNMPSLLSVNITQYEKAKSYKKWQSEFDKLGAVLALRQKFFNETGCASEQALLAQQQSTQAQQELAAIEVDPKYLKQSTPDVVLGLGYGHRRAVTLPTFIPVNDYANYQGVHYGAIQTLCNEVTDPDLQDDLTERDRRIALNESFVWMVKPDQHILPAQVGWLFDYMSKISSIKRLVFDFSLPPKANRLKVLGTDEYLGTDMTQFNIKVCISWGQSIAKLKGLREIYFDRALQASGLNKHRQQYEKRHYDPWLPLSAKLGHIEHLEVLSLRENQIHAYGRDDFKGLLHMLSTAITVVYVDLSRNQLYKLTETQFEQLVAVLEKMPSLQSVNITEYESPEDYAHLQPLFDRLRRRLEAQGEFYRRTQCTSTFQLQDQEAKMLDKSGESLRSVYINVRQFFSRKMPKTDHTGRLETEYARLLKRTQEHLNKAVDSPRTSFRLLSIAAKLVPSLMHNTQVMQGMSTLYRHLMAERMQVVKEVRAVKSRGDKLDFDLKYRVARYEGLFRQDDAASAMLMELTDTCSVQHVEWRRTLWDELLAIGIMADGDKKTLLGEQAMLKQIEAQQPGDARLCSASELSALLQSLARVTQYTIDGLLEADARQPQRGVLNANSFAPKAQTHVQQHRPLPANPNPRAQALAMLKQREQDGLHQKPQNQGAYGQPKTQKPPSPEGGSPDNGSPEKNTYLSTM